MSKIYIAVLMTCHNRRIKTLQSLDYLYKASQYSELNIDVFLVDDASVDGTKQKVKDKYPEVNIIQGNGAMYWNGGMRLAWETAAKNRSFDFFLWLNDDTYLFEFALSDLMKVYEEFLSISNKPPIVVGSCQESEGSNYFSYGGRNETEKPIIPNGKIQFCKYMNGNIVLVPALIFKALGNLSNDYTHSMGDFDYGLRAQKEGYKCLISKRYIAVCQSNNTPDWENEKKPLKKRWELLHSPKGLNIKEYNKFRKKFWGGKWIIFAAKAYLKAIFPATYRKLSNYLN